MYIDIKSSCQYASQCALIENINIYNKYIDNLSKMKFGLAG